MNVEKLSDRLQTVAQYIPEGFKLADIGSDHAYLPCHIVKKGVVPFAVAGEVVEGPYLSAKKQVESENLTDEISVRKGNGLEVISPGEVDCITIAGMGGTLIATILEEGKDKLEGVTRLILQPNVSAISIRTWLMDNSWHLLDETILAEDGKIYEVLVAEKGDPSLAYGKDLAPALLMGPHLIKKKTTVFVQKWTAEVANWRRILQQLQQSQQTEENRLKVGELEDKIKMVSEVISG